MQQIQIGADEADQSGYDRGERGAKPGFQPAQRSAILPSAIRKITMADQLDRLAGRRPAEQRAGVGAAQRPPDRDPICLGDQVVDGEPQVGVRGVHRGHDVLAALQRRPAARAADRGRGSPGPPGRASRPRRRPGSLPRRRGGSGPCWRRASRASALPSSPRSRRRRRGANRSAWSRRSRRSRAAALSGQRLDRRASPARRRPARACAKIVDDLLRDEVGQAGPDHRPVASSSGTSTNSDLAARRRGELGGHLGVGDRLGAGEHVRAARRGPAVVKHGARRPRRRRAGRSSRSAPRPRARSSRPSRATCSAAASTFDM